MGLMELDRLGVDINILHPGSPHQGRSRGKAPCYCSSSETTVTLRDSAMGLLHHHHPLHDRAMGKTRAPCAQSYSNAIKKRLPTAPEVHWSWRRSWGWKQSSVVSSCHR